MLGTNLIAGQKLPRVKGTVEAEKYPSMPNSEAVYVDDKEEDIIYFKATDQSGMSRTVRYRCIEEPEPTLEDKMSDAFVTKEDFRSFVNEFREFRKEIVDAQHSTVPTNTKQGNSGKQQYAAG